MLVYLLTFENNFMVSKIFEIIFLFWSGYELLFYKI